MEGLGVMQRIEAFDDTHTRNADKPDVRVMAEAGRTHLGSRQRLPCERPSASAIAAGAKDQRHGGIPFEVIEREHEKGLVFLKYFDRSRVLLLEAAHRD